MEQVYVDTVKMLKAISDRKRSVCDMIDDAPTAADYAALNAFSKSAVMDISQQRSTLGAIQNRLEHTINNLDNIVENTTSAESKVRDTDIATETGGSFFAGQFRKGKCTNII